MLRNKMLCKMMNKSCSNVAMLSHYRKIAGQGEGLCNSVMNI